MKKPKTLQILRNQAKFIILWFNMVAALRGTTIRTWVWKMGSFTGARLKAYKIEKERLEKIGSKIERHALYDTDYDPFDLPSHKNTFRLLAKTTAALFVASALLLGVSTGVEVTRVGPEIWVTTQNGLVSKLPSNFITQ